MAIPNVYDEIFEYAREYIKENSQYSPTILKDTPPTIVFPLVIIKQIADPLIDENLDKTDQVFKLHYEIEIYTMNIKNVAKQTIAEELMLLVNKVFDEHYGFTRKSNKQVSNIDTDVYRWYMLYEGKINEEKIIYRR